jgi:hypothetical protein
MAKYRYGTSEAWAKRLLEEEGVEITAKEVEQRLKQAGRKGKDARTWVGEILRGVLFSEKDVRMACKDLLGRRKK